jgi:hypothetical protein
MNIEVIDIVHKIVKIQTSVYCLYLNVVKGLGRLCNSQDNELFTFPLNFRVETVGRAIHMSAPFDLAIDERNVRLICIPPDKTMILQELLFTFEEDHFTARFSCRTRVDHSFLKPLHIEYFRDPELGMRLNTMKRGFCVPNAPMSQEDYDNLFPLTSLRGLASPPVLTVGMEFANGYVGLGLLDLSDATSFGVVHPLMGLRVDAKGQNLAIEPGQKYEGPRVVFFFPEDKWTGIMQFRQYLEDEGQLSAFPIERPSWWKRPTYCTYGDQIMDMQPALYTALYWNSPLYTETWVKQAVERAENRLDDRDFTVIIDAFWQRAWDTDPEPDPARFPHMREMVEWLHDRGHKVLLWYEPHGLDASMPDHGKLARTMGMLSPNTEPAQLVAGLPALTLLDYSVSQAEAYLQEISRKLFGSDPDCLNCDGVKMDFLFLIPQTEQAISHDNPQMGMGFRMVKRYLELFSRSAKNVKPDVCLNYSACDPRVGHLFDINRLHDTKVTYQEPERRARISSLANPNLLIDSDGAVMFAEWFVPTYIAAAIYSTPCLYYADRLNDGLRMSDKDMKTLGLLFKMCSRRYWGKPEFVDYGAWRLRDAQECIIGESYQGKLCWLKTGPNTLNLLCFEDQIFEIDLYHQHAKRITPEPKQMSIKGSKITAIWQGGVTYEIKVNK